MGVLQERITSTKTGSITSIQAVYVPADDLTDPSPATFAHLDATVVLSRQIASLGIYPAVDPPRLHEPPARSSRRRRRALQHCPRCAGCAPALQGAPGHHRDPRHGRAVGRGQAQRVSRPQGAALPVAAVSTSRKCSPARTARSSRSRTPSAASRASSAASSTPCRKQAFYMVGSIEEAVAKAKTLQ